MSADKYPRIFSRQMKAIVYLPPNASVYLRAINMLQTCLSGMQHYFPHSEFASLKLLFICHWVTSFQAGIDAEKTITDTMQ